MSTVDQITCAWLGLTSVLTFLGFGYDKLRARQSAYRVSEFHLVLPGAIGGWLGGLLGMALFRHKTAKVGFMLKYGLGFLDWAGLVYTWLSRR